MSQWYLSFDGKKYGPYEESVAIEHARKRPEGLAWTAGYSAWVPIKQIEKLNSAAVDQGDIPPVPSARTSRADEIDYVIHGSEMQYVEIELDPGESALAEAGMLMYKQSPIEMTTIFGDGSEQQTGLMSKFIGAGKRVLTGESLFMTMFTHKGSGKASVAFAAPYPGSIIPVDLAAMGGKIICQKDSFLCAAKGVSVGIYFQRKILTGLFGGEGFIMQKLEGDGMAFLHAGGSICERSLRAGEELHVDTGCLVGFEPSIDFDIQKAGGIKSMVFGGEGVFFARLTGPGKVWLQSLPFSRLAGRIFAHAPQAGGKRQGEGSVLGGIGDLLDGDKY